MLLVFATQLTCLTFCLIYNKTITKELHNT